jgi:antitoxin VapB
MAFHIKNPETDALARRVAALKKIGLTEAVHTALAHELEREQGKPVLGRPGRPVLSRFEGEGQSAERQAFGQNVPR